MTGNAVDLSRLPAPAIIEELSFEAIYEAARDQLLALDPAFSALNDGDPALKVLQVSAYRELNLRMRINAAVRAVMLAHATGGDLDNLVAREPYNIERLVVDPGNPDAIPPVDPIYESDESLRRRAQLAPTRYSTAGPEAAYIFHALSADGRVLDATATSPAEGEVLITVLSNEEGWIPSQEVLDAVTLALSPRLVRPLTDMVDVQAAALVDYTIAAELILYSGPDESVVLAAASASLLNYVTQQRLLGREISRSGIIAALHVSGVHKVTLIDPSADIPIEKTEIANLTATSITVAGRYE